MAITKDKKKEILEKLDGIIKDSQSVVFTNFHGLSVENANEMRGAMVAEKVGYLVTKKSLVNIALDKADIKGDRPTFDGELALAYGVDLLDPAREVYNFQKKFKDQISIIGGIFEGEYKSKEDMLTIASIPPMLTLRAQFVNVINSPIQGLVMALDAIAEKKA